MISARRPDAARAVAESIGVSAGQWPPPPGSWDLLVNATPIGSRAVPGCPLESIRTRALVYDLVYEPDPTELMQAAARADCDVIGGIEMLIAQAERQFELWIGQRPPEGLFREAAARAMRTRES